MENSDKEGIAKRCVHLRPDALADPALVSLHLLPCGVWVTTPPPPPTPAPWGASSAQPSIRQGLDALEVPFRGRSLRAEEVVVLPGFVGYAMTEEKAEVLGRQDDHSERSRNWWKPGATACKIRIYIAASTCALMPWPTPPSSHCTFCPAGSGLPPHPHPPPPLRGALLRPSHPSARVLMHWKCRFGAVVYVPRRWWCCPASWDMR
uniref:Uncharacterized protein n=1 Tax=Bos mutus grunniens TaxID=30521 RepID=A0A8B9XVR8_BOSMU